MKFDGSIGTLSPDTPSCTYYDLCYIGQEPEKMKIYLLEQVKRKGLEMCGPVREDKKDDGFVVSVRVKSTMGIV